MKLNTLITKFFQLCTYHLSSPVLNTNLKNSGKKSIPREQPNQNKIENCRLGLSLFMRDNGKCNIFHAPSTGLSGIQFSILNVFESLIQKDQTKNNNTEMKSGRLFTTANQNT